MNSDAKIRVTVVQPALVKYRVPVFRELASRPGLDVKVVYGSLDSLDNVAPDGFQATPTPLYKPTLAGRSLMFQPVQWSSASRSRNDVLVLQWSGRHMTLLPALLRARLSGVSTVLWGHGYSKSQGQPRRRLHQWLARFASALVFYEPRTRDGYVEHGWDPQKMFVALNALEHKEILDAQQWWHSRPHELDSFRHKHHLDKGPVVLFVSRLQPANRVDWLIRATAELSREIPGLKTVIIGNGAREKERLQQVVRETHSQDSIVFVDGIYDEVELAPWFLSSSVFCYPANVGLSLIHAMWYGLPVVTTNDLACQNPEVVALEAGVNGLTYNHASPTALASALRQILQDESMRMSMSQAARRTVETRFTVTNMVDGLEAAIRYAHRRTELPQ
jgi:glycosyltransferase involved in cell wall biosynthesis